MKYSLRFVWYVLRIVIVIASVFALLVIAFFVAMDTANVYVIVTDGMKARATDVLQPNQGVDLTKYFTDNIKSNGSTVDRSPYANFVITDFKYDLSVESLWCNPWKNTATVTVVESIPNMTYASSASDADAANSPKPPQWQRARYKITCVKRDGVWRIDTVDKMENLLPEPTASPVPSTYITASPLPTSTPTMSPTPQVTASPTPSPSPTKKK